MSSQRTGVTFLLALLLVASVGCDRPKWPASLPTVSAPAAPACTPVPLSARAISPANAGEVRQLARLGKGPARDVAYTADGRVLAVASTLAICLYDAGTMAQVRCLDGGGSHLALAPDGGTVAVASRGTIQLRRMSDGVTVRVLAAGEELVAGVVFSPSGSLLAAGSANGVVRVWRVADGALLHTLAGHTEEVSSLAFSPDSAILASGSADRSVRVWQAADGRPLCAPLDAHGPVKGLAFSPDGALLAAAGGQPLLWRTRDWSPVPAVERADLGEMGAAAFVGLRPVMLSRTADGELHLWRVEDGRLVQTYAGEPGPLCGVALSADSSRLACAVSTQVRAWQVADGRLLGALMGYEERVWSVAFAPGGDLVAAGAGSGTVDLWRVADGALLHSLAGHSGPVYSLAYSPDGTMLASGSADNTARVWRVLDGGLVHTIKGHAGCVVAVSFSPDGTELATASLDGAVRFWRLSDGALLTDLAGFDPERTPAEQGPAPGYNFAALAPNWDMLAWVGNDWLYLYRPVEARRVSARRDSRRMWSVAFSADGETLASGGQGTVRFWRAKDGALLRTARRPDSYRVGGLAFSPDGAVLAAGTYGAPGTVWLWRASDGGFLRVLQGHRDWVPSVAFSSDGATLASASLDGTLCLWGVQP